MRHLLWPLVGVLCLATAQAQPAPDYGHAAKLAADPAEVPGAKRLTVTSPAFTGGAALPRDATMYGANRFPGLAWSAGPKGTRSYLVIVQGAAEGGGRSSIHFVLFNLSAGTTSLAPGFTAPPAGAVPGPNVHGLDQPWSGPHPHTPRVQPYYFQVLALDRVLPAAKGQTWDAILAATRGHVLAAGSLVGASAQPADAAEPPKAPPPPPPRPADPVVSPALISREDATLLVRRSIEACAVRGEKAAAQVTDADGNLRAAMTADGMNTVGIKSIARKTATVLRFKVSTKALRERAAADPAFAAEFGKDERYYFSPGGLPLYRGNALVAVLAVGGGHQLDEECALNALKGLPWAKTAPQ